MRKTLSLALAFALSASGAFAFEAPKADALPVINGGKAPISTQAQCGAAWKADKAALTAKGYTWPAYYSACARAAKAERMAGNANAPAKPAVVDCVTDTQCEGRNPGL